MNYVTVREIIDDILLLVRNNNISESEDLSRSQIEAWINHYRRKIWKDKQDELKNKLKSQFPTIEELMSLADNEFFTIKETYHELEDVEAKSDGIPSMTKRTKDTLENIFDNSWKSILAVHDEQGENIQYMNHIRRHYHLHRKYTFGEMTAYYMDDKHVYVQGLQDEGLLKYIYVLALYEIPDDEEDQDNDDDNKDDEDNIKIPTWMVPTIKNSILNNELAFMLNRPSDDSNNATLASVKPHGPQDQEE